MPPETGYLQAIRPEMKSFRFFTRGNRSALYRDIERCSVEVLWGLGTHLSPTSRVLAVLSCDSWWFLG